MKVPRQAELLGIKVYCILASSASTTHSAVSASLLTLISPHFYILH